jgi:glycosyltransferase 2 family protein
VSHLHSELDAVARHLSVVDGRWVALALVFQLANLVLRSFAWRNVLRAAYPRHRVTAFMVGSAYAAGVALNALLPARGGEAAKVALVRAKLRHSAVATIVASSAVILVFDATLGGALLAGAWVGGVIPSLPGLSQAHALFAGHPLAFAIAVAGIGVLGGIAVGRLRNAVVRLRLQLQQGGAILRSPGRYLREVAGLQLLAWSCRVGTAWSLLAAFGIRASPLTAALVVVVGGLSTLVPATPGGAGTQQLLLVALLHGTASAAAAIAFSITLQASVTVVNVAIGLAALMAAFRTVNPLAAARAGARTGRGPG